MKTTPKIAYLTIDDGPTPATGGKLDLLLERDIPAVLFYTGAQLEQYPEPALAAIRQGFVVANHSYDHPYFSDLTVAQAHEQIRRTDAIIEALHSRAGVPRSAKYFRFPYGDKGALTRSEVFATPSRKGARRKAEIQQCLRNLGYTSPHFPGVTYEYWRNGLAVDVDWYWTYDVMEWSIFAAQPKYGITSLAAVYARMEEGVPEGGRGLNTPGSAEVILTHDHPETENLFVQIVDRLLAKGVKFVAPGN